MKNRVTIKDIAKEANVSTATVSYVLNNRSDQRISDETRKKVLQIANLFSYTCNFSARHISTGKSNIIALYLGDTDCTFKQSEQLGFALKFASFLMQKDYSLRLVPNCNLSSLNNCDAIVCVDSTADFFALVGNNNYIPLLAVDIVVTDAFFYSVNNNYEAIRQAAYDKYGEDYRLVTYSLNDNPTQDKLLSVFGDKTVFIERTNENEIPSLKNRVFLGDVLFSRFGAQGDLVFPLYSPARFEKLFECITAAINRVDADRHAFFIC